MKRRIIRADAHNWAIQEWQDGGDIVERGRFAGQVKQSKWKNPDKFYRSLEDAANAMLHEIVAENWDIKGKDIIALLSAASQEVSLHVSDLLKDMESNTLAGILQERGYTVKPNSKNTVDAQPKE